MKPPGRLCEAGWRATGAALLLLFVLGLSAQAAQTASLVEMARKQIGVTTAYDPAYRKLTYPSGDVATNTGVCSDVVVRAFRGMNIDLQKEVHEDMAKAFSVYPQKWGLTRPDSNIDHRRVLNLMTLFNERAGRWRPARSLRTSSPVTSWPGTLAAG